jgi:hypothetical protein
MHVMTPVGLEVPNAVMDAVLAEKDDPDWEVPLGSRFYGAFLDLRAPDYVGPLLSLVLEDSSQPDPPVFRETEPGVLEIRLSTDLLAWMYDAIRRDQEMS